MMYWMPAPAKAPVMETRRPRFSVAKATRAGGKMATVGNKSLLTPAGRPAIRSEASLVMVSILFLRVIAMIGKLVDRVNTGKRARK